MHIIDHIHVEHRCSSPHAHISLSCLCSLIELAALGSDGIVPSQLVSSVYPTHVPVVECNTLRAGDIMNSAISSLPTYSGGGKWRGIRSHHVDELGVPPYNDGDATTLTKLELTPLKVSCMCTILQQV